MQDDFKENLSEMKEEFKEYVENRIDLVKLHVVEKLSKITAGFAVKMGVLYLLFFALTFLSLAMAFFLGSLLESNTLGFLAVAMLYLVVAIVFYAMRHQLVEKPIIKNYIHLFFPNFDDHEE